MHMPRRMRRHRHKTETHDAHMPHTLAHTYTHTLALTHTLAYRPETQPNPHTGYGDSIEIRQQGQTQG